MKKQDNKARIQEYGWETETSLSSYVALVKCESEATGAGWITPGDTEFHIFENPLWSLSCKTWDLEAPKLV